MNTHVTPEEVREWYHIRRRTIIAKRPTTSVRINMWEDQ
jgi:hypothetical protein